jgi:hypothetical protein
MCNTEVIRDNGFLLKIFHEATLVPEYSVVLYLGEVSYSDYTTVKEKTI